MLVIAHRGASFDLPENTLPAFDRAMQLGVDYIEFDVHADEGGSIVVTHDPPQPGGDYPTLEEALDLMRGSTPAMVEVKSPYRYRRFDLVARVVRQLDERDVVVCFQRAALLEARRLRPGLRTVQHVGFGVSIRRARGAWASGFNNEMVTRRGVDAALGLGLVPLVYTVNEPSRMRELERLGVAGIFTDRPELALRLWRAAPAGDGSRTR